MNALWLVLGTLTAIRVPAPSRVDRAVAGRAMAMAPLAGLVLAVITVVPTVVAIRVDLGLPPWVVAVLLLAVLALLTRGMHLDGLADTADGLGSGRRDEAALRVMKQSDIGPFGVVALVLVLLLQAACLAQLIVAGVGQLVLLLALVASRGVLPLLCTRWFRPARADGLGVTVAGSVRGSLLAASSAVTGGLVTLAVILSATWSSGLDGETASLPFGEAMWLLVAVACALVPGVLLAVRAGNRFGGVTGDVYGAAVEVTFTATLVFALIAL